MEPKKQRIKIAEACGWRWRSRMRGSIKVWDNPPNYVFYDDQLPDYLNDLNVMRDAVMQQSGEFRLRYRNILADIAGVGHYHDATAPQRAEAFLKTLGLWED